MSRVYTLTPTTHTCTTCTSAPIRAHKDDIPIFNSDLRKSRILYGSVCRRKERLASTGRDAADLRLNSPPFSTLVGKQQKNKHHQGGLKRSQETSRQPLAPSTFDSFKATNVLPHGYFTASALMRSLGGTIFPPATTTTTETIDDLDYDDEDEDSPASTIVPPSPTGSRRNSFTHNGGTAEEDLTPSSGDNLSSSVEYGEYDNDIVNDINTNRIHTRPKSHTSNTGPLPRRSEAPRANPRVTAAGPAAIHEQRGNHQRNPTSHPTTRGGEQQHLRLQEAVATKPSRAHKIASHPPQTPRMEERASPGTQTETSPATPTVSSSKLHPRVAVILGVDRKWYLPLVVCRAMSVGPALWWGLRCAFTFLAELLRIRPGSMWREGWVAIVVSSAAADWDVERRFRVTEVALAIMWVCSLPLPLFNRI